MPGVVVDAQLLRHYPHGELFSHALGYVGRINERETFELDETDYRGTFHVGKVGVEKYYEDMLHGDVGYQNVETNAHGRVLRVLERYAPTPGVDLTRPPFPAITAASHHGFFVHEINAITIITQCIRSMHNASVNRSH